VSGQEQIGRNTALVIGASSVGTVFEWYDFYLYASLATVMVAQFFSGVNAVTGLILALLAFAAGFAIRPLGAIVFGRLGDLWGRKNTFLVTMILMGLSTVLVGVLPSYAQVGLLAPAGLVGLRLIQGLSLGGEYGGAATYVAEHAPADRRGLYTSFITTTASMGLLLSLVVILVTRTRLGEGAFLAWGWRIPYLVSAALLAASVWIRLQLKESPAFQRMLAEGRGSKSPLRDAFGHWGNLKLVLTALLAFTAGQAVIWYSGQYYALFFLEKVLKVDGALTNVLVAIALFTSLPLFILFGWLSDRIGRKRTMMAGMLIAALTYVPLYKALTAAANPALARAAASAPVTLIADPADCSFQFDPVGKAVFDTSCDIAKSYLAKAGVSYRNQAAPSGAVAAVKVGDRLYPSFAGHGLARADLDERRAAWEQGLGAALVKAGYPAKAEPGEVNRPLVVVILLMLMVSVAMVSAPIAAVLVEMFPTRIRYTSMSLPYHIGNGWFGGFLPAIVFAMVAAEGDIYFGLWYPVGVAAVSFFFGLLLVRDRRRVDLDDVELAAESAAPWKPLLAPT
jgi:MFS family permease